MMTTSTGQPADPPLGREPPAQVGHAPRWLLSCFLILTLGFALRVLHILWKYDVDWEPDGYQHLLFAQSLFASLPRSLWLGINVWAKPLYTLIVAIYDWVLPAGLPRLPAVQLLNTVLWCLTMVITIVTAAERFRRATLVALCAIGTFTFAFFRDSISANTEPMGALVLAGGIWLWSQRRQMLAVSLFGLLPLVRLDGALIGLVFWLALVRDLRRKRGESWLRPTAAATIAFFAPVALWNLAGLIQTGSPLYLLTHGYRSVGAYGFGGPFHFVVEFLKFDTLLFVFYVGGLVRIVLTRRPRDRTFVLVALASGLHFLLLTIMWVFGLASAGLLRYFVFVYPAYLLVDGVALDRLFEWMGGASRRLVPVTITLVVLVGIAQLNWLVRPAEWHHSLLTSMPDNRIRFLPANPAIRGARMIYTDRPDVMYYLGRNMTSPNVGPLTRVRDPSAKGIFVFAQGWSELYAGVQLEEFWRLEQLDRFTGPYGEVIYVFRR
jgi:hypothetical protein